MEKNIETARQKGKNNDSALSLLSPCSRRGPPRPRRTTGLRPRTCRSRHRSSRPCPRRRRTRTWRLLFFGDEACSLLLPLKHGKVKIELCRLQTFFAARRRALSASPTSRAASLRGAKGPRSPHRCPPSSPRRALTPLDAFAQRTRPLRALQALSVARAFFFAVHRHRQFSGNCQRKEVAFDDFPFARARRAGGPRAARRLLLACGVRADRTSPAERIHVRNDGEDGEDEEGKKERVGAFFFFRPCRLLAVALFFYFQT